MVKNTEKERLKLTRIPFFDFYNLTYITFHLLVCSPVHSVQVSSIFLGSSLYLGLDGTVQGGLVLVLVVVVLLVRVRSLVLVKVQVEPCGGWRTCRILCKPSLCCTEHVLLTQAPWELRQMVG